MVFYLFIAFYILSAVTNLLARELFRAVIPIVSGLSLWFTYKLISNLTSTSTNNSSLTSNEKMTVIITELFNPVISGGFYYYGLKKIFPNKAKQANKYAWIIVVIYITLVILYVLSIIAGITKI